MANNDKVSSIKKTIFLIGVSITSVGIFLPWINTIFIDIIGVFTWGGAIVSALLATSVSLFFMAKDKEILVSVVLIVTGIISILIVFPPSALVSNPIVWYGIGTYVTAVGSIFIMVAGIIGLLWPNNKKKAYPFEDH